MFSLFAVLIIYVSGMILPWIENVLSSNLNLLDIIKEVFMYTFIFLMLVLMIKQFLGRLHDINLSGFAYFAGVIVINLILFLAMLFTGYLGSYYNSIYILSAIIIFMFKLVSPVCIALVVFWPGNKKENTYGSPSSVKYSYLDCFLAFLGLLWLCIYVSTLNFRSVSL